MTFDPVCGMRVSQMRAVTFDYEGTRYFFCSDTCRGAFIEDPELYAEAW